MVASIPTTISQGPTNGTSSYSSSQTLKIGAALLFVVSVTTNIFLSKSLQMLKGLRSQEFGISDSSNVTVDPGYIAANIEQYMVKNSKDLNYETTDYRVVKGCDIWKYPSISNEQNFHKLQSYKEDLDEYTKAVANFSPVSDLMEIMHESGMRNWPDTCRSVSVHPDGIEALFPSGQLSYLKRYGFMEPLTTPMRHPVFCESETLETAMRLDYMVHDFEKMCLTLKPHSRRILIDLGASLQFHSDENIVPIISLIQTYNKFGFKFDHIYGFELSPINAEKFYNVLLPQEYFPSFHWINAGTTAGPYSKMNPFKSILSEYNEDDFIVVKLDIDTSSVEVPLAKQLLENERLTRLVDQFYFENHVNIAEMAKFWRDSMEGTIKDSFDIMQGLRKKGIATHFWN